MGHNTITIPDEHLGFELYGFNNDPERGLQAVYEYTLNENCLIWLAINQGGVLVYEQDEKPNENIKSDACTLINFIRDNNKTSIPYITEDKIDLIKGSSKDAYIWAGLE